MGEVSLSARDGYYVMAHGEPQGPYRTVNEAKEAASSAIKTTDDLCIRTVLTVERVVDGKWVTVH